MGNGHGSFPRVRSSTSSPSQHGVALTLHRPQALRTIFHTLSPICQEPASEQMHSSYSLSLLDWGLLFGAGRQQSAPAGFACFCGVCQSHPPCVTQALGSYATQPRSHLPGPMSDLGDIKGPTSSCILPQSRTTVHVCIHTDTHMHTQPYLLAHICLDMAHSCVYTHTFANTHMCVHTITCSHVLVSKQAQSHVHIYLQIQRCTHSHTSHTISHVYTHTHIVVQQFPGRPHPRISWQVLLAVRWRYRKQHPPSHPHVALASPSLSGLFPISGAQSCTGWLRANLGYATAGTTIKCIAPPSAQAWA
jgi:hypothetical protein